MASRSQRHGLGGEGPTGPIEDSQPGKSKADRSYSGYRSGAKAGNSWDGEIDPMPGGTKQVKRNQKGSMPDLGE